MNIRNYSLFQTNFVLMVLLCSIFFLTACDLDPNPEGCKSNDTCTAEEYCKKDKGTCNDTGKCTSIPDACPNLYDPVCGCDGNTYANSCTAAVSQVNVQYNGECNPDRCTDNSMCGSESYCYSDTCDQDSGVCKAMPDVCAAVYDPVCGCDGKTYGNSCEAAAAGANVDYQGECKQESCFYSSMCNANSYCYFYGCEAETGSCKPKAEVCTADWDPVCSCSGKTYGNACEASAAGVNVDYKGECK